MVLRGFSERAVGVRVYLFSKRRRESSQRSSRFLKLPHHQRHSPFPHVFNNGVYVRVVCVLLLFIVICLFINHICGLFVPYSTLALQGPFFLRVGVHPRVQYRCPRVAHQCSPQTVTPALPPPRMYPPPSPPPIPACLL